ncbi:hypothetical protein [Paludibacterium sp. THUN1379]|uniref:hypothetical protein n=1 Tax=Paludibacterium sp. THUN1379 TaxID=3112107 RepID=UPI0030D57E18
MVNHPLYVTTRRLHPSPLLPLFDLVARRCLPRDVSADGWPQAGCTMLLAK